MLPHRRRLSVCTTLVLLPLVILSVTLFIAIFYFLIEFSYISFRSRFSLLLAAPSFNSVCEILLRRRNKKKRMKFTRFIRNAKGRELNAQHKQCAAPHTPTSNLREQKTQIQLKSFHENERTAQNGPDECVFVFERRMIWTVPLAQGIQSHFRLETSSLPRPEVCFECWKCFCVNKNESKASLRRSSETTICHRLRCGSILLLPDEVTVSANAGDENWSKTGTLYDNTDVVLAVSMYTKMRTQSTVWCRDGRRLTSLWRKFSNLKWIKLCIWGGPIFIFSLRFGSC